MESFCAPLAVSLLLLFVVPHEVLAEAAPSDAQLHATKPAIAHDLITQQRRHAGNHHAQAAARHERAKKGATR
jgi:hypothetical protein